MTTSTSPPAPRSRDRRRRTPTLITGRITPSGSLVRSESLPDQNFRRVALGGNLEEGKIVRVKFGANIDEKALVVFLMEGEIAGVDLDVCMLKPHVPKEMTR
ncbi:glyoxylate reductase [Striga asiatica]|uniref:Glyoxylate reductase n=1 Tax=Striga asiatica TaxID=4170 RepID=A0A5A7PCQ7_STRAF|nr:glyoxylate reductase [Striga asiatica]